MSAHLESAAAKKLCCCCTLLLLFVQWRTCTKTAAAALHWRDRITRALRGDRAAGGGHYKARVLRSSARNTGCAGFCTNFEREKALHHVLEYRHGSSSCIAMCCTFCRLFDAHAAAEYNEKAPGAPCFTLSCSSTFALLMSRSFSFLPSAFQGLFS